MAGMNGRYEFSENFQREGGGGGEGGPRGYKL